jgi:hypothetical protein
MGHLGSPARQQPDRGMKLLARLRAYARVLGKANRNQSDLTKHLVRRPAIGAAVAVYETAVLFSNRLDARPKYLATTRVSSLIGCPF